jgi:hypothetical protein
METWAFPSTIYMGLMWGKRDKYKSDNDIPAKSKSIVTFCQRVMLHEYTILEKPIQIEFI